MKPLKLKEGFIHLGLYKVMLWTLGIICFILISVQSDVIDISAGRKSNAGIHEESFVEANNAFALRLYKHLSSTDGNVFFCPACLSASLAMLMDASVGETTSELNKALQLKGTRMNSSQIRDLYAEFTERMKMAKCLAHFTSVLFVQKNHGLKSEFAEDAETFYNTEILETDFSENPQQAVWDVNESVKIKTRGRIKRLFERLDTKNSMLLVNALHFKTNFVKTFDSDVSLKGRFYNHGFRDHDIEVFVMEKKDAVQKIANSYDFRALELSCGEESDSTIKVWIFLPHKADALADVEYGLSTSTFRQIQKSFKDVTINITIPRIKFEFSKDISKDLQKLGLQKVFDSKADFSSMSDIKGLYISEILQRAIIDINGNGMHSYDTNYDDLASKTNSGVSEASTYVPPFKANHPFVFSVIDSNTGLILYLGRVYEF